MRYVKVKIVHGLESLCELTGHHWCHRLAVASMKLDLRWKLNEWTSTPIEDEQEN